MTSVNNDINNTSTCEICGFSITLDTTHSLGVLKLCESCSRGEFRRAQDIIGLQYSERFDYFAMSDPGFQFYVFEIRIPSKLTIDLRMSKELL
jgi:hypothetical protein